MYLLLQRYAYFPVRAFTDYALHTSQTPVHTTRQPFPCQFFAIFLILYIINMTRVYMKKVHIPYVVALVVTALFSVQCDRKNLPGNEYPAQWIFNERNTPLYAGNWVNEPHVIRAMNGSAAYITVERSAENEGKPFEFTDMNGNPFVRTLTKDDCILFCMPADGLAKGSSIEIEAALISNPSSPKYFIVEYMEDGVWKHVEEDVRPVPENPALVYSFRCSGIGYGEPHEYTSVYQTVTLESRVKGPEFKVRFRAVGDFTCSGHPQTWDAKDGGIGFVHHGFNGAYIQNYGTAVPADTTDVLCIGNSFTYFSNVPSMMKEIAWSQGHYFNIKANLKGGQTLGQHTGRILTEEAASYGDYDVAFLQDQSQTPARYAQDSVKHSHVADDYLKLSDMVKANSPGIRIVMEQTWAYPSQRFGGFGDFATFTDLLDEGAHKLAAMNGAEVSPIGDAFEIVYNENKNIRLYDTDNKHQSHYGAYLKACVNYLIVTGEAFHGTVASCGLENEKAEYLQKIAEKTVLGN